MIRIAALNEESDEESESEKEEVTREALEEIALQQYAKTLEMQKKGNHKDALKLLKELLDTELLDEVRKPVEKDNISRPLLNLKYLCYRNIATISAQFNDYEAATEAYLQASELDDTDVTLWYRLGKISLQCEKFELASFAFQRGVDCNPKHWPCIDNLITVLLGLGEYHACIENIYKALLLDSDYYRGKVYRKHIFTEYSYVLEYLRIIDPIYNWTPGEDVDISGQEPDKLLKEASIINDKFIDQMDKNRVVERLPILSLQKPIAALSWLSLGESLANMHIYMSENELSHACLVEISQPVKQIEPAIAEPAADVEIEPKEIVDNTDKEAESKMEVEKTEDAKANSENEKEQEPDNSIVADSTKNGNDKDQNKKGVSRRRGSSLSFLEQWEWCTKRRSSRKKISSRQERNDENIYETLKRLVPQNLLSDDMKPKKSKDSNGDDSLDTMDIYKLFEEKEKSSTETIQTDDCIKLDESEYFGTEKEERDVENFITKYMNSTCDIITMIDEFVLTLSQYWKVKWPEGLGKVFVICNQCSKQHIDPPLGSVNSEGRVRDFIYINLLHLEIEMSRLMKNTDVRNESVDIEIADVMKYLCSKFQTNAEESLDIVVRYLWVRCHMHLYQDNAEFALDCLYQILSEFDYFIQEKSEGYSLNVPNFLNKSTVSKHIILDLLKSLERNKQLSTVLSLYEIGKYEEILPILQDSFKQCQIQANKQEWSELGLDWALHLILILEVLWEQENTEQCFTWSVISLHEALKQYLLCSSGSTEYEKWTMTVVKILMIIEHILKKESSSYLEILPEKALALMVQDIVQIIVHQLDEGNNEDEMPLKTTVPWILLHYILQREEDCGRSPKKVTDDDDKDDVPPSIMVLFTAHNYLGKKGWCTINEGYLLYFILNVVMPRFRSPALSLALETISQCLEQVVFCIVGHPSKKTKNRYLYDHNITPHKLDWSLAQQIFELYRPYEMPEFNSYRLGSITNETEQLFQRMLSLLPTACEPQPYIADVISYIENKKDSLPETDIVYPYKVRDIYYLLADYYLKNNETQKALKYYAYDIVINKQRFDSWAGIALARASLLETKLNSCETFKTEMEYLNRAAAVERCFKKALDIDSSHSMLWIEYGAFVYGVHSFCSRMLKQASESLSMENFDTVDKRKDDMLNTAHRCFVNAHKEWLAEYETDDKTQQDERWLHYYMLGKISEKKGDDPIVYLEHYIKAGKYLLENNATYPSKINYNNPQNLSVEALEIHYRINASILKYIEQHENKTISFSVGKSFKECLMQCMSGPFSRKKQGKDSNPNEKETVSDNVVSIIEKSSTESSNEKQSRREHESIEDEVPNKKIKLDTDKTIEQEKAPGSVMSGDLDNVDKKIDSQPLVAENPMETDSDVPVCPDKSSSDLVNTHKIPSNFNEEEKNSCVVSSNKNDNNSTSKDVLSDNQKKINSNSNNTTGVDISNEKVNPNEEKDPMYNEEKAPISEIRRTSQESTTTNTATSKEESTSNSSSDSSSDDSSSDSSSDSSNDADMSIQEINDIISICLDNLEDCVSRFPQHYKALYRLAHYHFYYKKDKNVQRCRDLMLGSFISRSNSKLQGLFCERKNSNFFNSIWRIPASEIDRPGSFASHMSRCVLITMEVLKEIDDHKTLLDLSIQLQKTPEAEKKYLRDSERTELAQQAFSLCNRSIKGLFNKFGQGNANVNSADKKVINDFILDIYRSYQKVQKHMPSKGQMFSLHLVDCYKYITGIANNDSNTLEMSIKYCQSLASILKQQGSYTSSSTNSGSTTPNLPAYTKKVAKSVEVPKTTVPSIPSSPVVTTSSSVLPTLDLKQSFAKNVYSQNMTNPLLPYLPTMDPLLSALSYHVSNMAKLSPATSRPDFLQQFISSALGSSLVQQMKSQSQPLPKAKAADVVKRPKPYNVPKRQHSAPNMNQVTIQKVKTPTGKNVNYFPNYSIPPNPAMSAKNISSELLKNTTITSLSNPLMNHQKSYNIPSSSSVITKPAHLSSVQGVSTATSSVKPAHMVSMSTTPSALHTKPPMPHQQVSPGKTLQEKLAERQKQNPSISSKAALYQKNTSPKSIATAAFSGKIPSSLTITKSSSSGRVPFNPEVGQSLESSAMKRVQDAKKINRPEQSDAASKPKNVVDTSEIIILDDD